MAAERCTSWCLGWAVVLAAVGCAEEPVEPALAILVQDDPDVSFATDEPPTWAGEVPFVIDAWACSFQFATRDGGMAEPRGVPGQLQLHFFALADFPEGPTLDQLPSQTRICTCTVDLLAAAPDGTFWSTDDAVAGWQLPADAVAASVCGGVCGAADATALGDDVVTWAAARQWWVGMQSLDESQAVAAAAQFRDWDRWSGSAATGRVGWVDPDGVRIESDDILVLGAETRDDELVLDDEGRRTPLPLGSPLTLVDGHWTGVPLGMATGIGLETGSDTGAPADSGVE